MVFYDRRCVFKCLLIDSMLLFTRFLCNILHHILILLYNHVKHILHCVWGKLCCNSTVTEKENWLILSGIESGQGQDYLNSLLQGLGI